MSAAATALSPIDPIEAAVLRERARCIRIVLDSAAGRDCYTVDEDWPGTHECCCWRSQLAAVIEEGSETA